MHHAATEGFQLAPQQRRLWSLLRNSAAYHALCAARLEGPLNRATLKRSAEEVVRRHEILRTSFQLVPALDFAVQVISGDIDPGWHDIDLRHLAPSQQEIEIERLFEEESSRSYDLDRAPLLRLSLLTLSENSHVLLISLPAMCADGQALENLLEEISKAYAADLENRDLADVPVQYADFSEWQNELLREKGMERNYWARRGIQQAVEPVLPYERQPKQDASFAPEYLPLSINSTRLAQLQLVARQYRTTTTVFLQACWHTLIYRLTGQPNVMIGTLFNTAEYEELSGAVGLFAKWLPVQTRIEGHTKFREVLVHLEEAVAEAGKWAEHFSWESVGETTGRPAGAPFFPFGYEYHEPAATFNVADLSFSIFKRRVCLEPYKVKLSCSYTASDLSLEFYYDPERLRADVVEQLVRCFDALLASAVQEPEAAVGTLDILGEIDCRRIVDVINRTETDYPSDKSVQELFEAQVERTPHAVAVVFQDQQLTYAELNAKANQLAHFLLGQGVSADVPVGLLVERSTEMLVGVLGVLKAGGAYVPLDPEHPSERLIRELSEIESPILVTQESLLGRLLDVSVETICLDKDRALLESEPQTNLATSIDPRNLAYVTFTSGSTGAPKGVAITHRSLLNYSHFMLRELHLNPTEGGPQLHFGNVSTLAADLGNTSIFPSLISGGCLHLLSYETATDSRTLAEYVSKQPLDLLKIVPSHLNALLSSGNGKLILPRKYLVLGGEALSWELLNRLAALPVQCQIVNHYGPTETTVGALTFKCESPEEGDRLASSVPIGRPIANTEVYVLDRDLKLLPAGVPGELFIGGAGLARGYLNRPDSTAERFIPNPLDRREGERLYRTGDLVRYLPGGKLEFLGRVDHQVKVHGFRIELGEIEAALRQHPFVRESVVVAKEEQGDRRLIAYVVAEKNKSADRQGRQLYRLPNNMLIAHQNKHETDFFYRQIFVDQTNLKGGITLADGPCVFDVGANIGLFTLFVHQRCRNATVYAFEPAPPIFDILRANVELYGVNARLFDCGLAEAAKTLNFTFYPEESCMSGFYADEQQEREVLKAILSNQQRQGTTRWTPSGAELERLIEERIKHSSFPCRMRTLSDVVRENNVKRIDLLKIDVEKSELDVLAGIEESDWPKIKQLVIEAHDLDERIEQLRTLLGNRGYEVSVEQDEELERTDLYNVFAVHSSLERRNNGRQRHAAFELPRVAPHAGQVTIRELRSFLEHKLPSYMIPGAFVMLKALPLTRNGKVDRSALPAVDFSRPQPETTFVTPRTPTEEVLANIWSQVLGVEKIGIDDNFFALGGDSIRSIQVRYLAQERGLSFTTQTFFEHPTIRELSQAVQPAQALVAGTKLEPFGLISEADCLKLPDNLEDAYPLTMLQAGMIYHSEYNANSSAYHDITSLHLRCRLDIAGLQSAVNILLKRHSILRTSFDLSSYSEPLQLVHRKTALTVKVEDLRDFSLAEQEEKICVWMEQEKLEKFQLTQPPLLRVSVHLRTQETFQLSISHHHAIIDGWSNAALISELLQTYLRLLADANYSPASLATSYRDFVVLEREAATSLEGRQYWLAKLSDSTLMTLPRRPSQCQRDGARLRVHHVEMDEFEVSERLKQLARSLAVPLKSVLLAAHMKVMSSLSGHRDVVTGLVSHGRPETADGERVLGLFLNSLPFRMNLRGGTWSDLVQEAFQVEQESIPHARYPLAELQRHTGGQPLFEVLFNYSHFHVYEELLKLDEIQCLDDRSFQETNFTLLVNFTLRLAPSRLQLDLEYDAHELSEAQVSAIGGYYLRTLTAIANDPFARHEVFIPLSSGEQQRLLTEWNATDVEYAEETCVHRLFEKQVEMRRDEIAIRFGEEQLTYGELNTRANQLAHYLRSLGVGPDTLVGILLERSIEMVVAVLGVLKAGGAYVPLDPRYPRERFSFMFEDSGLKVLLTQRSLSESLSVSGPSVVLLPEEWEIIKQEGTENLDTGVTLDNLVYVIYTSGSTGRPKGIGLPQRALANLIRWHLAAHAPDLSMLQFASLSFDVSFNEIFVALCSGQALYVVPEELRHDVPALLGFISGQAVQKMMLPVVVLQQLAEDLESQQADLPSLRELIVTGEQLQITKPIVKLFDRLKSCSLHNHYGPSETHVVTAYRLPQDPSSWPTHPSIGRPISNTKVYLLDEHLNPVAEGVAGELYIGGVMLARCYVNRPDMTAQKFIPDPFSREPGARLYRTGDLSRYLHDGNLEFLGRIDHQVKIRGFRVELGEVESVLNQYPGVREAVVLAREEASGGMRLVAYVVPEMGSTLAVAELRDSLKKRLPDHMIPSAFVLMASFPLTPNAKVDRRALPAPSPDDSKPQSHYVAPTSLTEEVLESIWAGVLGFERVSIHDNFFDLGGHSLKATQIMSRVRSAFQIELPLRILFESPTVAGLAGAIEQARQQSSGLQAPPIQRVERDGRLPLSYAQQRLWFLNRLMPESPFYNVPIAVRLNGVLDAEALELSLRHIEQRHEVLRTCFSVVDSQPVQVISPEPSLRLHRVDLSASESPEQEALKLAAAEAQRAFDLSRGPVWRAVLARLSEEEHVLVLTAHHIVTDQWSMGVLVREVGQLYEKYRAGETVQMKELEVQYADYAVWQRKWLQAEVLDQQLGYWKQQLAGAPTVLDLPTDHPRPAVQAFNGAAQSIVLPKEVSGRIRELSRREGATLFMTLLAALNTLIYRCTGQTDIVIGTGIANRNRAEIEHLIGFFVNTLVLRTDLSGNPTFRELLGREREVALGAYAHQDMPFERLVEELQPGRKTSHNPLFQVAFFFQNAPMSVLELSGITLTPLTLETNLSHFDMTLVMSSFGDQIAGVLEYNTDLFEAVTISRLLEHFRNILEEAAARPELRLLEIPILTDETNDVNYADGMRINAELEQFVFETHG